jgi:hypothetical protein
MRFLEQFPVALFATAAVKSAAVAYDLTFSSGPGGEHSAQ